MSFSAAMSFAVEVLTKGDLPLFSWPVLYLFRFA
jgi:hypothetical protein